MAHIRSCVDYLYALFDLMFLSSKPCCSYKKASRFISKVLHTNLFKVSCDRSTIVYLKLKEMVYLRKLEFFQNCWMKDTKLPNPHLLTIQPQIHRSSPLAKISRFIDLLDPISVQLGILKPLITG